MLHKKLNQDLETQFFNRKIDSCQRKSLFLNYLKTFKAVRKNNPRMHSLPQNEKGLLTTAVYFKVSTSLR